jgi:hypothetical protein
VKYVKINDIFFTKVFVDNFLITFYEFTRNTLAFIPGLRSIEGLHGAKGNNGLVGLNVGVHASFKLVLS